LSRVARVCLGSVRAVQFGCTSIQPRTPAVSTTAPVGIGTAGHHVGALPMSLVAMGWFGARVSGAHLGARSEAQRYIGQRPMQFR